MGFFADDGLLPDNVTFADGREATLAEIAVSARENMRLVDNALAADAARYQAYDETIEAVARLTGERLENPFHARGEALDPLDETSVVADAITPAREAFGLRLHALARQRPQQREEILKLLDVEGRARTLARNASDRFEEDAASRDDWAGFFAALGGGMAGSLQDPIQLGTLFAGGGPGGARTIAGRIAQTAFTEAAVNGAVEAVLQPSVQAWRQEIGVDAGLQEAIRNVGLAAALGGAFGGLAQGVAEGLDARTSGRPERMAKLQKIATEPETAAQALEPIREALTADARGALDAMEADRLTAQRLQAIPGLDADEADAALQRALSVAANPARETLEMDPAPARMLADGGVDDVAAPTVDADTDALIAGLRAELTELRQQLAAPTEIDAPALQQQAAEIVAGTSQVRLLDAGQIKVDAKTFQFKDGGDAEGVTARLQGVERWKPEFAGMIIAWENRSGDVFVADGHQRTGLARRISARSGEKIEIPATVFREADGYSADDVRTIAALKNIAEGSGTALDAAKVLRTGDAGLLADLPPNSALVRDAAGLARLSDNAFTMVINGLVDEKLAAVVGRAMPDPALHAQALDVLKREGAKTIGDAQSMVADLLAVVNAGGVAREVQDSLFGAEETSRMLLKERAAVRAAALNQLKNDKKFFANLTEQADVAAQEGNVLDSAANARRAQNDATLIELIEKLSNRAGPVADAFNAAARDVAGGGSAKAAARAFVDAVRSEIERAGGDLGSVAGTGARGTGSEAVAAKAEPELQTVSQIADEDLTMVSTGGALGQRKRFPGFVLKRNASGGISIFKENGTTVGSAKDMAGVERIMAGFRNPYTGEVFPYPAAETGADNADQLLIDGVAPIRQADRDAFAVEKGAAAPMRGGNQPMDIGLFGPDKDQGDMADLLLPAGVRIDTDGNRQVETASLTDELAGAGRLADLADLVRSCKS